MTDHHITTDQPTGADDGDEQARQRIEELLDALRHLIDHDGGTSRPGYADSGHSSSAADAMRLLARYGWLRITQDNGNRLVRGRWIPAADRLPLPPGVLIGPGTAAMRMTFTDAETRKEFFRRVDEAEVDRRCAGFVFEKFGLPRGSC